MALSRISDLTSVGSDLRSNSLAEVSLNGTASRKATMSQLLAAFGVAAYTVGTLPSASPANKFAYATDGRKSGEGAGNGTGVIVRSTGSVWQTVDTATTVAA